MLEALKNLPLKQSWEKEKRNRNDVEVKNNLRAVESFLCIASPLSFFKICLPYKDGNLF